MAVIKALASSNHSTLCKGHSHLSGLEPGKESWFRSEYSFSRNFHYYYLNTVLLYNHFNSYIHLYYFQRTFKLSQMIFKCIFPSSILSLLQTKESSSLISSGGR